MRKFIYAKDDLRRRINKLEAGEDRIRQLENELEHWTIVVAPYWMHRCREAEAALARYKLSHKLNNKYGERGMP